MTSKTTVEKRVECPNCGKKGRRVSLVTLHALLKEEFARDFANGEGSCCAADGDRVAGCQPIHDDTGWRFCDSQDCDVVYFSEAGDRTFIKSQLKVPVGVKETSGERPLCYCFGHSVASIKEEIRTIGRSKALEDIRAKMKAPGCRCETTNPSGSCCLGSVAKGIKIAQQELGEGNSDEEAAAGTVIPRSNRGEVIAKVGAVISAIIASACCWLPLLLVALGVSGAGIASTLESYRPLFIVVTLGFLGAAFYFTYRPKKAVGGGHDCCAPQAKAGEDCCSSEGKRRFTMMTLNKAMLWIVTTLAIAFLFFPNYVGSFLGGHGTTVTKNVKRAEFKVEGMTCEGCAAIVEEAIRSVPGVLAVEVDYQTGKAVVGTDACCPVPIGQILAALKKAGYTGHFVQELQSQTTEHKRP